MLRQYVLLLCAAWMASAVGVHVSSAEMNVEVNDEAKRLAEETAKVQEELSQLAADDASATVTDSQDVGVKQEVAYKLPADSEGDVQGASDDKNPVAPPMEEVSLLAKVDPAAVEHTEEVAHLVAPEIKPLGAAEKYFRPGVKTGKPDIVNFGMKLKNWYGIDFKAGTCCIDVILATVWKDERTKTLVPSGAATVRLALSDAESLMWLPDIQVTNIAKKPDIISSSVMVDKDGTLTKVQRVLLTLKQGFNTDDFPFDTQTVQVKVASRVYMADEMTLAVTKDDTHKGVKPELFEMSAWNFKKWSTETILDEDGILKKSRGVLNITVKRVTSQFGSSIFIPSVILLVMTWCTLWFPFVAAFVMPRVAISVISMLCMMALLRISMGLAPASRSWTWLAQYLEICMELQFLLMVGNALFLAMYHRRTNKSKDDELAKHLADRLDNELIAGYPIFAAAVLGFVCAGFFGLARILIVLCVVVYIASIGIRYQRVEKKAVEEDAERENSLGEKVTTRKSSSFVA